MSLLVLAALLLAQSSRNPVGATMYAIQSYYAGTNCDGTPYTVNAFEYDNCTEGEEFACDTYDSSSSADTDTDTDERVYTVCSADYQSAVRDTYGSTPYILALEFADDQCSSLYYGYGILATGNCEGSHSENGSFWVLGNLYDNGSALVQYYNNSDCLSDSLYLSELVNTASLTNHSCENTWDSWYEWYSSTDDLASSTSGSKASSSNGVSTGTIIGIVCGCVVVVLVVASAIFCCRRRKYGKRGGQYTTTLDASSLEAALSGQTGLWNDDVITAKRIPRDKVKIKKLLSRGAYGEVYNGVFNGQKVAVKMLLPATRGNLEHVTDLLTEAKLTASMDHPHIVSFIGVAWDSLSDLCVVLEFMDGGDLRTLLNKYEASKHPVGVDREKATIALHVCHALTYLHSLTPPVIHRDLKSRNILLNQAMEAKLTDFGISRERLDQTMTAGVGTSLWMAPEVMLGENYGVEADMFSFGVVLSELDVHTLPYAQAKQRSLDSSGRKMADARLLQKITTGEMRVDFSDSSPKALVELGNACVAVAPDDRPTAAEALYRLQVILSQELAE
jgi:serine/threonine-protein kinase TNNI3K